MLVKKVIKFRDLWLGIRETAWGEPLQKQNIKTFLLSWRIQGIWNMLSWVISYEFMIKPLENLEFESEKSSNHEVNNSIITMNP